MFPESKTIEDIAQELSVSPSLIEKEALVVYNIKALKVRQIIAQGVSPVLKI